MTTIDRSALLPHSAQHLYDLVADIERYPEFLDGCVGAEILERDTVTVTARLRLSRAGLSHSFVTRNTMHEPDSIALELVDGPFEKFTGQWLFTALSPEACKVALQLSFRLRSGLVHAAAGKLFDRVAVDMVDAVVRRAGALSEGERP